MTLRPASYKSTLRTLVATLACLGAMTPAQASDPEIEALKEMVKQLQQEVATMKAAMTQAASAPTLPATPQAEPARSSSAPGKGLKIYGVLDSGVEWVSNAGANHANLTRIPSTTGSVPSRLGFDFEHELRPGLKGIARAEMGFYLDTGDSAQGSRLFGRQIYVGLDSDYGSLTVGRQYSMLFYSLLDADLIGPNIHSLGSIDAYIPNARADNAIAWRGKFGNVSLGATYSFGRDTEDNTVPGSGKCSGEQAGSSQCRAWSGLIKYDAARFGVAAAMDQQTGGTDAKANFFNGSAPLAFSAGSDTDTRLIVNGYARFGALKLGAGLLSRKLKTDTVQIRQDTTWLQAGYPLSPELMLEGGAFLVRNDDQQRDARLYVLRGVYSFDAQLASYVSIGHIDNSALAAYSLSGGGAGAAPAAGFSQNGVMTGLRYRF
jgi:predicted porin